MSLFDSIDIYCERLSPALLAEPINAVTNLAFIFAVGLLWNAYRKNDVKDIAIVFLIMIVAAIGIGSVLFHTFANGVTLLADVIPIMIFVYSYLYLALTRLLKFSKTQAIISLVVMFIATLAFESLPREYSFNGSAGYFPCLFALGFIAWKSKKALIYLACVVFALSLTMRSMDMAICPYLEFGTHFLWHVLNGLLLYLLVIVLIKDCADKRSV